MFSGREQSAIPPLAESHPITVGFVDVDLFDFNFRDLDNHPQFSQERDDWPPPGHRPWTSLMADEDLIKVVTPHYPGMDPWRGEARELVDRNSAELGGTEIFQESRDRMNEFDQAAPTCTGIPDCGSAPTPPTCQGQGEGCQEQWEDYEDDLADHRECLADRAEAIAECEAIADEVEEAVGTPGSGLPEELLADTDSGLTEGFFQCFDMETIVQLGKKADEASLCFWKDDGDEIEDCLEEHGVDEESIFTKLATELGKGNIRARPYAHCLPQLGLMKFNMQDADSYEQLHPLEAGWGCGGIRGRIVPNSFALMSTGTNHRAASPALVTVEVTDSN